MKKTNIIGLDCNIIIALLFLCTYGIIIIYSASGDWNLMTKQLVFTVAGFIGMLIVRLIDFRVLKHFSNSMYFLSLLLILLLLVPGLSDTSHGATRWLKIAGISIQVAEVVKLFMILFLANIIAAHLSALQQYGSVIKIWLYVGLVAALLLFISSNLSSCLILLMITYSMTFIASEKNKFHIVVLVAGMLIVGCLCLYFKANLPSPEELEMMDYHFIRIVAWLAPDKYANDASYQILQGLYAIGSGGFWGVGLGNSTQKAVLPETANDMILCVIAEELGVFGVPLLLFLFLYLFYQILIVACNTEDQFGRFICAGVLCHLSFQTIINVGVATNTIPNTGYHFRL